MQALNVGGTLTDSFTVTTADGTAQQLVTITIHGANDAAVITASRRGSVAEAGGVNNGTAGTPTATGTLTDTDVDNPSNTFVAVAAGAATPMVTAPSIDGGGGTGPTRWTTTTRPCRRSTAAAR